MLLLRSDGQVRAMLQVRSKGGLQEKARSFRMLSSGWHPQENSFLGSPKLFTGGGKATKSRAQASSISAPLPRAAAHPVPRSTSERFPLLDKGQHPKSSVFVGVGLVARKPRQFVFLSPQAVEALRCVSCVYFARTPLRDVSMQQLRAKAKANTNTNKQ